MRSDILQWLATSKNGLEIRALAKALGWDDLISLNRELLSLQSSGQARISQNRWQATPSGRQTAAANSKPTSRSPAVKVDRSVNKPETSSLTKPTGKIEADALATVPVQARRQQEAVSRVPTTRSQGELNVPALLSYYRACLSIEDRSDPKAGWDEAGTRFTPIRLNGPWWPTDGRPAILTVARSLLPEGFQQAMGRSTGDGTIHLGYPIDVFGQKSTGVMVRAVCSVPLRWKATQDDVVVFETVETSVTLNAGWMAYHRKHVNFQALADRIGTGVVDDDMDDGEADTLPTQQFDLKELCLLLNMAFAKKRNGELKPEATDFSLPSSAGMHNVAALFVTGGARYSAASIRDLEVLAKAPATQHQGTALGTLLGLTPPARADDNAVLEPIDLTYSQLAAVRSALSEPLSVITGPPGTGKSQVVTAILASAAAHGRTVLFASRNHAALDAVEPRLAELSPDRPLMVRFSRRWGDGTSVRIADLIRAIVARPVTVQDAGAPDNLIMSLSHLDNERAAVMDRAAKIAADRHSVAALEAELAQLLTALRMSASEAMALPAPQCPTSVVEGAKPALSERVLGAVPNVIRLGMAKLLHKPAWHSAGCPIPSKAQLKEHEQWVAKLQRVQALVPEIHRLAASIPSEDEQTELGRRLERLTGEIGVAARRLMPTIAKSLDWIDEEQRQRLMEIRGNSGKERLTGPDVRMVLRNYPIWALSNLTVAKFTPPEPIFDYVVIDEASQCDIASALPLLARARQAIIVGDPAQLGVVSTLSPDWEVETLGTLGLANAPGIGRFRQSRNSLFDVASTVQGASRHLLTDHFRCHADIAAYVETFYGSQLSVLTETGHLRPPPGQRPGLYWEPVDGPVLEASKGCHSPSEAAAIIDALRTLLIDQKYEGSVGVCTPFREQANRLSDKIAEAFPPELVAQRRLIAQTANGFQGDARDVIFISPCLGSDMPMGSLGFVREGGNLFNVAVSRAKAVCCIFGNADFARQSGIPHITRLIGACDRQSQRAEAAPIFDSPWEERLFVALAEAGIKCTPQYPIAGRRLDLAWFSEGGRRLDIEVDGDRYHRDASGLRKVDDLWRDHQLRGLGWEVIRFWVYELREDVNGCVERVRRAIAE